ncbi:MAG TPA: hypothetical protein VLG27_00665 [Candidatus Saccharimonadia bacterium]|nr:hypothetical protein [Candidatus Saccharimonadia bacterium]
MTYEASPQGPDADDFYSAAKIERRKRIKDAGMSLGLQGMNPAVADERFEDVRSIEHERAVTAVHRASGNKRRPTNKQQMAADVNKARIEHDPGIHPPRLESAPEDTPEGTPVPREESYLERERRKSIEAQNAFDAFDGPLV